MAYSKHSDGILYLLLSARPSHKSNSESDGVKSGLRSEMKNIFLKRDRESEAREIEKKKVTTTGFETETILSLHKK